MPPPRAAFRRLFLQPLAVLLGLLLLASSIGRALDLGNLVFIDQNGNAVADVGEGVSNVQVQLFQFGDDPEFDSPLQAQFTTSDGRYQFTNLTSGFYFVFIPPSEFQLSKPLHRMLSLPGDGFEQDDDFSEDGFDDEEPFNFGIRSDDIFLEAGELPTAASYETGYRSDDDDASDANGDLTIDFGFFRPVSIGNLVYVDLNANGIADAGEGVSGVELELFEAAADPAVADPVLTTLTDEQGFYLFTEVSPGSYRVRISPAAFQAGGVLVGMSSLLGTPGAGADDDVGEDGIDGGTPVTDGILSAAFSVTPGSAPTAEDVETGLGSDEDDLADADADLTIDFGLDAGADRFGIGNLVFEDFNANGIADEGEGLDGIALQLFAAGSDPLVDFPLAEVTSNNGGQYFFGGLTAGSYFVHIPANLFSPFGFLSRATPLPPESVAGDDDQGQDGVAIGEPDLVGVSSATITLAAGTAPVDGGVETGLAAGTDNHLDGDIDLTVDFGFTREVAVGVGNVVFYDADQNGVYSSGEGVSGVSLWLFREGQDPATASPLDAISSGVGGNYRFSNLRSGRYFVHVPPAMFQGGGPLEGNDVVPGQGSDDGVDDGVDENGGDVPDPEVQGVSSSVVDLQAGTEPTAADGETGFLSTQDDFEDDRVDLTLDLGFRAPCPLLSLGSSTLAAGTQGQAYQTTLTTVGGTGPYVYSAYTPPPAGLTLTAAGSLEGTPLVAGTFDFEVRSLDTAGCAAVEMASITIAPGAVQVGVGNLVFIDGNLNGDADPAEGAEGVVVQLFQQGQDALSDVPVLEQTTDADGVYQFLGLLPGNYFLHVPASMFEIGQPLHGHVSVTGAGGDDGLDDDVDENGIDALNPLLGGISTSVIALAEGAEPTDAGSETGAFASSDGADANIDLTIDFGFESACSTLVVTPDPLENGWVGVPYNATLEVSGGLAPYTFTLVSGLPAGLSLSTDGTLSGIPQADESTQLQVSIVDSRGCTGAAALAISISTPPSKGKVGNLVFVDANLNGHFDDGEGIAGVTVELMTYAPPRTFLYDSMVTDSEGRFLFVDVDPGTYLLQVSANMFEGGAPLEGMVSVPGVSAGDDDVGEDGQDASDPQVSGVLTSLFTLNLGSAPTAATGETGFESSSDDAEDVFVDLTWDLGFVPQLPPNTFALWQAENPLGGENGVLQNPDGDRFSNLVEYGLLLNADSALAMDRDLGFRVRTTGTGVEASFVRRVNGGSADLIYTLEGRTGFGAWTPLTVIPVVESLGTGQERVTFSAIQLDAVYGGADRGEVRLSIGLDATLDEVAEENDVTPSWTWQRQQAGTGTTRTFSMPFFHHEVLRATAGNANGALLDLTDSLNATDNLGFLMQQQGAGDFYLEVLTGPAAGHRAEVDEFGSTVTAVAVDFADARSTLTGLTSVANEEIAIRRHWTLKEVLPVEGLNATTNPSTADHVLFYDTVAGEFDDFFLLGFGPNRFWVEVGDSSLTDKGDRLIGVADGCFVRARSVGMDVFVVGQERSTGVAIRLQQGINFVGNPNLEAGSPAAWNMTVENGFTGSNNPGTSDRIQNWSATEGGYQAYFLLEAGPFKQWTESGDGTLQDQSNVLLFDPFQASFIISNTARSDWLIPPPLPPL